MEAIKLKILRLLKQYLNTAITKRELITELYKIEIELSDYEPIDKDLWFKFFRGDTASTTIKTLELDLERKPNEKYMNDLVRLAVERPNEFKVYFS